jgi:hypothetical protein
LGTESLLKMCETCTLAVFVADEEVAGDLAVGHSVGEERKHFDLSGCQFELLQRSVWSFCGAVVSLQVDAGSTRERLDLAEQRARAERLGRRAGVPHERLDSASVCLTRQERFGLTPACIRSQIAVADVRVPETRFGLSPWASAGSSGAYLMLLLAVSAPADGDEAHG